MDVMVGWPGGPLNPTTNDSMNSIPYKIILNPLGKSPNAGLSAVLASSSYVDPLDALTLFPSHSWDPEMLRLFLALAATHGCIGVPKTQLGARLGIDRVRGESDALGFSQGKALETRVPQLAPKAGKEVQSSLWSPWKVACSEQTEHDYTEAYSQHLVGSGSLLEAPSHRQAKTVMANSSESAIMNAAPAMAAEEPTEQQLFGSEGSSQHHLIAAQMASSASSAGSSSSSARRRKILEAQAREAEAVLAAATAARRLAEFESETMREPIPMQTTTPVPSGAASTVSEQILPSTYGPVRRSLSPTPTPYNEPDPAHGQTMQELTQLYEGLRTATGSAQERASLTQINQAIQQHNAVLNQINVSINMEPDVTAQHETAFDKQLLEQQRLELIQMRTELEAQAVQAHSQIEREKARVVNGALEAKAQIDNQRAALTREALEAKAHLEQEAANIVVAQAKLDQDKMSIHSGYTQAQREVQSKVLELSEREAELKARAEGLKAKERDLILSLEAQQASFNKALDDWQNEKGAMQKRIRELEESRSQRSSRKSGSQSSAPQGSVKAPGYTEQPWGSIVPLTDPSTIPAKFQFGATAASEPACVDRSSPDFGKRKTCSHPGGLGPPGDPGDPNGSGSNESKGPSAPPSRGKQGFFGSRCPYKCDFGVVQADGTYKPLCHRDCRMIGVHECHHCGMPNS